MKKRNKFIELINDIIDSFLTDDWYGWISKRNIENGKKKKRRIK